VCGGLSALAVAVGTISVASSAQSSAIAVGGGTVRGSGGLEGGEALVEHGHEVGAGSGGGRWSEHGGDAASVARRGRERHASEDSGACVCGGDRGHGVGTRLRSRRVSW
jgi:hypothetical protein